MKRFACLLVTLVGLTSTARADDVELVVADVVAKKAQAEKDLLLAIENLGKAQEALRTANTDKTSKQGALVTTQGLAKAAQQLVVDAEGRLRSAEAVLSGINNAINGYSGMSPGLLDKVDPAERAYNAAKGVTSATFVAFDADRMDTAKKKAYDDAVDAETKAKKAFEDAKAALAEAQKAKAKAEAEIVKATKDLADARTAAGKEVAAAVVATKAFDAAEAAVTKAQKAVTAAEAAFKKAQENLQAAKMAAAVPLELLRLRSELARLEGSQKDLAGDVKNVQSDVRRLSDRVSALEKSQSEIQNTLAGLEKLQLNDRKEAEKLAMAVTLVRENFVSLAKEVTEIHRLQTDDHNRLPVIEAAQVEMASILAHCVRKNDLRGFYGLKYVQVANGCGHYTAVRHELLVK